LNHNRSDGEVQKSIHRKLLLNKSGKLITKMAAQELREITAKGWQIQTYVAVTVPHINCFNTAVLK